MTRVAMAAIDCSYIAHIAKIGSVVRNIGAVAGNSDVDQCAESQLTSRSIPRVREVRRVLYGDRYTQ